MIFGSPRQALAYLFACERGPRLAQPRYHDAPPSTDRHHLDHVEVGAMLYGRNPDGTPAPGCCGIERGSELDRDLRRWATERGDKGEDLRTNGVLAIERKLRALLRAQGALVVRRRLRAIRAAGAIDPTTGVHTSPDGTPTLRAIGFAEEACATVQDVLRLP